MLSSNAAVRRVLVAVGDTPLCADTEDMLQAGARACSGRLATDNNLHTPPSSLPPPLLHQAFKDVFHCPERDELLLVHVQGITAAQQDSVVSLVSTSPPPAWLASHPGALDLIASSATTRLSAWELPASLLFSAGIMLPCPTPNPHVAVLSPAGT
jgi:hypothetical protein